MKTRILLLIGLIFFTGCTSMIHELKTDPAIVGITGWWFSFGLQASPESGGIPMPAVRFGRGTIWRIGVTDAVTIKSGEHITVTAAGGGAPAVVAGGAGGPAPQTSTGGEASLEITTKDTSKALEKMKDLYK